jgi:hypothetical protein
VFLAFVLGDFCEKKISMCYVVVVGDGVRLKVFPNADDEKLKTYGYRRNRHLNGPLSRVHDLLLYHLNGFYGWCCASLSVCGMCHLLLPFVQNDEGG